MAGSALLRNILNEVREKKVLTPIIRSLLVQPDFTGFFIEVEPWTKRLPDGWFHPSTHATWPVEKLVQYLVHPDDFVEEEPEISFVLSVTQGKFWHKFVQYLLLDHGILLQDEVPILDPIHRRKGHADGLLSNGEILEFKTASARAIKKIADVESLIANSPVYYAQTQDYLDVLGAEHMRYLVMCKEPPYPFEEYIVPADPMFQAKQRIKYREALEMAAELAEEVTPIIFSPVVPPIPEPRPSLRWGVPLN